MKTIISHSEGETFQLGVRLGTVLTAPAAVLFYGELGAGKTVFIRGVCSALGVRDGDVHSPSYTLINEYRGTCLIFHADLFRLAGEDDLYEIGLDEILDSDAVVLVEWAERMKYGPLRAVSVHLRHLGQDDREVRIEGESLITDRICDITV